MTSLLLSITLLILSSLYLFFILKIKYDDIYNHVIITHLILILSSFFLSLFLYENMDFNFYLFTITGAVIVNMFLIYVSFLYRILFKFFPINPHNSINLVIVYKYKLIFIIFLTLSLLGIRIIMFNMSIGITGIAPPSLPYKISGLLSYLASIFIPLGILYTFIYSKYLKSRSLAIFILLTIILCGCLSASRSLVFMFGCIFFMLQFKFKRYFFSFLIIYLTLLGFHLATEMRSLIYQYDSDGVYMDPSLFNYIDLYNSAYDFSFSSNLISLVNRFSGLENIYNSMLYNVNNVENPFNYVSRLIYINFNISDSFGNHNTEWFGRDIPGGLYDGPTELNSSIVLFNYLPAFLLYGAALSIQFFIVSKLIHRLKGSAIILSIINLICTFILMFSIGTFYFYATISFFILIIFFQKFFVKKIYHYYD